MTSGNMRSQGIGGGVGLGSGDRCQDLSSSEYCTTNKTITFLDVVCF